MIFQIGFPFSQNFGWLKLNWTELEFKSYFLMENVECSFIFLFYAFIFISKQPEM